MAINVIGKGAEKSITQINYQDVSTGKIIERYYAGGLTSNKKILSKSVFYSDDIETSVAVNSTGVKITRTYEDIFQYPRIVEGGVITNFNTHLYLATANSCVVSGSVIIEKEDTAGSSTELARTVNQTLHSELSQGGYDQINAFYINVPRTKFGKKEKIKATYKLEVTEAGGAGSTIKLYHDPRNRTTDISGSTAIIDLLIPFIPDF